MATPEHLAILEKGVKLWNLWRDENPLSVPDLSQANLENAELDGANLRLADLNRADLSDATLIDSYLTSANLEAADLNRADISVANFSGAYLPGANLAGATADFTTFANVDLSQVRGLDLVEHMGPSSVGLDTIYLSDGKIPHNFLRGAGVPEDFIEYMASLVGTGIEF
jgi:hypothetical protein